MKKTLRLLSIGLTVSIIMAATVDLNNLFNYENQTIQPYITADNTGGNEITDLGATLGRVLFYDKNLSLNNTVSCASCHLQEFAFSDTATVSEGFDGGVTHRHSMRLVNTRFAEDPHFFWDERADSLEMQATMPIKDSIEMGFSGLNGQPDFDSLVTKLYALDYYNPLFQAAFGDTMIDEDRIQKALAQFMRSIQSFDSKYDEGRAQVSSDFLPFPNYTTSENNGKDLFVNLHPEGASCVQCHKPPEFQIDGGLLNNGVIGVAGDPTATDLTNTRSATLRDLVNPNGDLNGPLMHDGSITTLADLIDHYNNVPQDPINTNLDPRLQFAGGDLQLTAAEKQDLINFLKTLTGSDVYTNEKWSDPFDANGDIDIIPLLNASLAEQKSINLKIYPNPVTTQVKIISDDNIESITVYSMGGKEIYRAMAVFYKEHEIQTTNWDKGMYILYLRTINGKVIKRKIVKS